MVAEQEMLAWKYVRDITRNTVPQSRVRLVQSILQHYQTVTAAQRLTDLIFNAHFDPEISHYLTLLAHIGASPHPAAVQEQLHEYVRDITSRLERRVLTLDPLSMCRLAAMIDAQLTSNTTERNAAAQSMAQWRIRYADGSQLQLNANYSFHKVEAENTDSVQQRVQSSRLYARVSKQGWLNMNLPPELVQLRRVQGKRGKPLTMLNIELPDHTLINSTDYAGWHISVPATRHAIDALDAQEVVPVGVRPGWNLVAHKPQSTSQAALQPNELAAALNVTLRNMTHAQAHNRVAAGGQCATGEHWNMLRGAEPDLTYQITPQAQRTLAIMARDKQLIAQFEGMSDQFALEYLNGIYQPSDALERVLTTVEQYITSGVAVSQILQPEERMQVAHSILGALTEPINGRILHHIQQGTPAQKQVVAQYQHDLEAQINEFIEDYSQQSKTIHDRTEFHPYRKLTVAEAFNMFTWGVDAADFPSHTPSTVHVNNANTASVLQQAKSHVQQVIVQQGVQPVAAVARM